MKYSKLVELYEKLDSTTKILEMTDILADFLKSVNADELEKIVLLAQGVIFPRSSSKEIGIADNLMIKAVARLSGAPENEVKKTWQKTGDIGNAAQKLLEKNAQKKLGVSELTTAKLIENMEKASQLEGSGTVDKKINLIAEVLSACNPLEARYAVRTILGVMRLGVGDGIVRDALSKVFGVDKNKIEDAYNLLGDYGKVAGILKKEGEIGLKEIKLSLGRPINSMLFTKVETIKEGFEVVGRPCLADIKYDGMRAQIHYDGKNVKIFTRRLEDVTKQFPEIADAVKKNVKCESCILDSEAVGYDKKKEIPIPFQQISRRIKRKYDIEKMAKEMPTKTFVFDCLEFNGKSLVDMPFKERRKIMDGIVKKSSDIQPCDHIATASESEIQKFLSSALKQGHEGLMMKSIEAEYKPGRRVGYGVKLKPGMETFDLVVVEAIWGDGRRSKWLTSYVLACRNDEKLLTIGKMSSGPTEEEYEEITKILKPLIIKTEGKKTTVKPKLVLEVGYQELQKSPTYESGFALRFPTLKSIRYDKPVSEADDLEKIKRAYKIT